MSEAGTQHGFDLTQADVADARMAAAQQERGFYLWLLVAALCHALLLTGFSSATPRRLGDPSGIDSAMSVSLVSEADLQGRAAIAERAAGLPAPSVAPAEPAQAVPAPAEPPAPQPPAPQEHQEQQPEKPAADAASELAPMDAILSEFGLAPPRKQSEVKPGSKAAKEASKQAAKPAKNAATDAKSQTVAPKPTVPQSMRTTRLDLTPSRAALAAVAGSGGAGLERPAGITRSGENDDFARGVIRALQGTMPQLSDTFGQVTVRITLDINGNLINTEILSHSKVAILDQSVVFATKQTNFPFPPRNANSADLIFIVTYIYR